MPPLTLNQAAKAAGRSKSTISEAIKKGRMSAIKDDKGRMQIDPAELFREFPAQTEPDDETDTEQAQNTKESGYLQGQIDVLRELLEQIKEERDDLRKERDHWRQQATHLLPAPTPPAFRPLRPVLLALGGLALAIAAALTTPFWVPFLANLLGRN